MSRQTNIFSSIAKYKPIKIYFTYTIWIKRDDLIRTTRQIYGKDDFIGQEKKRYVVTLCQQVISESKHRNSVRLQPIEFT